MVDVVDKFGVRFWEATKKYYCSVIFPDGHRQELNSVDDLNFAGWQAKISAAWAAHINPPPDPKPVTLDEATLAQVAAEVKERCWTAKDLGLDIKEVVT